MSHRFLHVCLALAAALTVTAAQSANAPGHARMFGKNHPFGRHDLPPGRVRTRLDTLPAPARSRALEWLHRFDFPEHDLDTLMIDAEGAVFYADPAPTEIEPEPAEPGEASDPVTEPVSAADDAFLLHSRPGAANVVYLDFDGQVLSGTAWSSSTLYARPFDLDGSPGTFGATERAAIAEIWHRVAEDYAAFDIDVTTEAPAVFGPTTGRILITGTTDANGLAMPSNGGGGVAYVNVWGRSNYHTYYSPALVYYENLAKTSTYIAEACAHEFGHNLGLSHDGNASSAYYAGHGSGYTSWAPIMGNGYYNNVTQWSRGEYSGANNTQDDIALIAGYLDLAADDHGDSRATATTLVVDPSGAIEGSDPEIDPHNAYPGNKGVIDAVGDWDYFSFSAAAGTLDLTVNPAWQAFYRTSRRGANLDLRAVLQNAQGGVLAESDPGDDTYARVTASVPAGTYYLAVTGVGSANYTSYASQGQYYIAGNVPAAAAVSNNPPTADFGYGCMDLSCNFTNASTDSDGTVLAWAWDFGDGTSASVPSPSHTYAAAGTYKVTLTVTDNAGTLGVATRTLAVAESSTSPQRHAIADFGGDGMADILLRNAATGWVSMWEMNGNQKTYRGVGALDPAIEIVGVGDFNGDGMADILLRNTATGWVAIWEMNGSLRTYLGVGALDPAIQIVGVGDFNGDGMADILLRNVATGWVAIWEMNGGLKTYRGVGALNPAILIAGVGDLNGDGKSDILLRNATTGWISIWEMNGNLKTYRGIGLLEAGVEIVGLGDLTGDGKADIVRRNTATGWVSMWEMNGNLKTYRGIGQLEPDVEIQGLGDLTGEGKADLVRHNTATGWVSMWKMDGNLETYLGIGYAR